MNPESRLFRLQLAGSLTLILALPLPLALVLGPYFILHDLRWFENSLQAMKAVTACKASCGEAAAGGGTGSAICGGSVPALPD